MPFNTWTAKTAADNIPDKKSSWLKANIAFYEGDHWQNGKGWSGPMLPADHEKYRDTQAKVQAGFCSVNAIAEVVDRHVTGVAGRLPIYNAVVRRPLEADEEATEEEQALIQEAEALITSWMGGGHGVAPRSLDSEKIKLCAPHEVLQLAITSMLLSRRGSLRLFVTPAAVQVDEQGQAAVEVAGIEDAIGKIFVHHPGPTNAAVVVDEERLEAGGVYVYKEDGDGTTARLLAELSYLDPDPGASGQGRTVIRIVDNDGKVQQEIALDLGGRLTIYEMERQLLVNEQVRQNQKALNKAYTMSSRNLDQGGFLERLFLNAQMPGTWSNGVFTPQPMEIGPGTANFLSGVEIKQTDGTRTLATPNVVYRDPVSPETFIKSADHSYRAILAGTDQLHVLIAGEAAPSGEARSRAKDDFKRSLLLTKSEVDAAVSWLLETVLALAAELSGQAGRYESLRITADCQLDLGVVSSQEQQLAIDAHKGGILSRETAMRRCGVVDPAAEAALIDAEANHVLDALRRRAEVIKALTDAGVGLPAAAAAAGMSKEEAQKLLQADFVDDVRQ